MRPLFATYLVFLFCQSASAQEEMKPSPQVKRYADLVVAARQREIATAESKLANSETLLATRVRGRTRMEARRLKDRIEEFKTEINVLKQAPYKKPDLSPFNLEVGDIGRINQFCHYLRVVQVLNESRMIIVPGIYHSSRAIPSSQLQDAIQQSVFRSPSAKEGQALLVIDVSTKGIVTNARLSNFDKVFEVTGTKTYRTISGGSNTAFVLKFFDERAAKPHLEELRKQNAPLAKPLPKKPPKGPVAQTTTQEQRANSKLRMAKLLEQSNPKVSKERLEDLVRLYPDTKAAAEARHLIKRFR